MLRHIGSHARFAGGLRRFLRTPVTPDRARAHITARLADREAVFLSLLERAVFDAEQRSPYRALFDAAGCTAADARTALRRDGLDAFLGALAEEGVRVPFDAFKGRAPLEVEGESLAVTARDFDNPFTGVGFAVRSGGSSGRATRTQHDLEFLETRAAYEALMLPMLGLERAPLALWYPRLPASTGLNNALRYVKVDARLERWFQLLEDGETRPGLENRLAMWGTLGLSRLAGRPIPWPEPTRLDELDRILDWAAGARARHARAAVQSYVSRARRLATRAAERGLSLEGVTFLVGSEPLPPTALAELEATGARVYERYMATEIGSIAMGCGCAGQAHSLHLLEDTVAAIAPDESSELLLSTLSFHTPKIMINVELGDSARLLRRECSCAFGQLGLTTRIEGIRGRSVVTLEGMTVSTSELGALIETVLAPRAGGSPLDFQWIHVDHEGAPPALRLLIDPRLGAIDEEEMIDTALEALGREHCGRRLIAAMWRASGALSVQRETPRRSAAGKQASVVFAHKGADA